MNAINFIKASLTLKMITSEHCIPCKGLKQRLDKEGIEYEEVSAEGDPNKIRELCLLEDAKVPPTLYVFFDGDFLFTVTNYKELIDLCSSY